MTNTTNLPLLLIQCACFCTTLVMALVLTMSRRHLRTVSRSYETSRWLLVAAMMLYALHYALQMIFGFRAQGEDVGALINIIFYLPIAFLMVCATLRISSRHSYLKRFVAVGLSGIVGSLVIFGIGLAVYRSLCMPWALRALEVLYVGMIAFFIFKPGGELQKMYRKIEDETADDISMYYLCMRTGTVLIYVMGLIGALSIFSTATVVAVAVFFLVALVFYVVCFVSLGFSVQALSSVVEEDENEDENEDDDSAPTEIVPQSGEESRHRSDSASSSSSSSSSSSLSSSSSFSSSSSSSSSSSLSFSSSSSHLTAEQTAMIEAAIAAWRADHGYCASNLTSITMAQRLGIQKRLLTQYLAEHEGVTFRVWLSNIRIEEAKRMLLDKTEHSIEAVAERCGFSSRSWMQEKFKASTGLTPAEWREAQGHKTSPINMNHKP